jgi:hypothetical protein
LSGYYDKYSATTNNDLQKKYIEQGITELNNCDMRFNLIVTSLNDQLMNIGYHPEAHVTEYRRKYEEVKQKNIDKLLGG